MHLLPSRLLFSLLSSLQNSGNCGGGSVNNYNNNNENGNLRAVTPDDGTSGDDIACNDIHMVLRFDGSLRYPSDSGFPTSATTKSSSVGLRRVASCAACLLECRRQLDGNVRPQKDRIVAVGGKRLDNRDDIDNSAQVEYEGVLLALEGLQEWLSVTTAKASTSQGVGKKQEESNNFANDAASPSGKNNKHDSLLPTTIPSMNTPTTTLRVTVQGDCKTVIEQLQGKARTRKLQPEYDRVQALLQNHYPSYCCDQPNGGGGGGRQNVRVHFRFEHIPRSENCICDRVSAKILHKQQQQWMLGLYQELDAIHAATMSKFRGEMMGATATMAASTIVQPRQVAGGTSLANDEKQDDGKLRLQLSSFLNDHFLLDRGSGQIGLTPFSLRPALYRRVAWLAARLNDYQTLLKVGQQLQEEARTVWVAAEGTAAATASASVVMGHHDNDHKNSQCCSERLWVEGIVYQLVGMRGLGKHREATKLEKNQSKHRYLLRTHKGHAAAIKQALSLSQPSPLPTNGGDDNSGYTHNEVSLPDNSKTNELLLPEVEQWYQAAVQSSAWEDTGVFWLTL